MPEWSTAWEPEKELRCLSLLRSVTGEDLINWQQPKIKQGDRKKALKMQKDRKTTVHNVFQALEEEEEQEHNSKIAEFTVPEKNEEDEMVQMKDEIKAELKLKNADEAARWRLELQERRRTRNKRYGMTDAGQCAQGCGCMEEEEHGRAGLRAADVRRESRKGETGAKHGKCDLEGGN